MTAPGSQPSFSRTFAGLDRSSGAIRNHARSVCRRPTSRCSPLRFASGMLRDPGHLRRTAHLPSRKDIGTMWRAVPGGAVRAPGHLPTCPSRKDIPKEHRDGVGTMFAVSAA